MCPIDDDHSGFLKECAIFGVKSGGGGSGNFIAGVYTPAFTNVLGISGFPSSPMAIGSYVASDIVPGSVVKWSILFQVSSNSTGDLMEAIVTLPSAFNANFVGGEQVIPDGFTIIPQPLIGVVGAIGAGCFNSIIGAPGNNLYINFESALIDTLYQVSIAGTFTLQAALKK